MVSCCSCSSSSSTTAFPRSPPFLSPTFSPYLKHRIHLDWLSPRKRPTAIASLRIGIEEIAEVAQNKVLVAATVATAIGQLSKPFTSAFRGNGIDLRAAVGSGGMPSTHSAAVVAVATCLGLERGFSDSIFGMSVVFASIVMYDAQGVRREVGNHAKSLNTLKEMQKMSTIYHNKDMSISSVNPDSITSFLSIPEKANSFAANQEPLPLSTSIQPSKKLNSVPPTMASNEEGLGNAFFSDHDRLNESVGHTEIQVVVGALLGFLVSLAIETIL